MSRIKPNVLGTALSSVVLGAMAAQSAPVPLTGDWAGDRVQLKIDAQGGSLEGDCLSGRFAGPVLASPDGRFSTQGPFVVHAPGPTKAGGEATSPSATYSGEVQGSALTLTVTRPAQAPPEVYHLLAGARVKLIRCL
jgi:hypothetical protein